MEYKLKREKYWGRKVKMAALKWVTLKIYMPHLLLINHHSSQAVARIANFNTYYKHEQEFHHCNILFSLSTFLGLRTVVVHSLHIHKTGISPL